MKPKTPPARAGLIAKSLAVETAYHTALRHEQRLVAAAQQRLAEVQQHIEDYQCAPDPRQEADYLRWLKERGALHQLIARQRASRRLH